MFNDVVLIITMGGFRVRGLMLGVLFLVTSFATAQETEPKKESKKSTSSVSFKNDVLPILKKQCLPCHAEENFNPSELSLDSYDLLKMGGKHGEPFVPGKSKESLLIQKLGDDPPFGGKMPLNSKKKIQEGKAKFLTEVEIKTIATWIDQGAKKN